MIKKSIKLTNGMRDKIIAALIENAFREPKERLTKKRYAFSEKVYNDLYDKKTRDAMQSLPEGWLIERDEFAIQFGEHSSGYCQRNLCEPKRFLARHACGVLKVYDNHHRFAVEHSELEAELYVLRDEKSRANAETRAVIYSCGTTARLKEVWPEIAGIVEQYEPSGDESKAIVPVLQDLNKKLGLKR